MYLNQTQVHKQNFLQQENRMFCMEELLVVVSLTLCWQTLYAIWVIHNLVDYFFVTQLKN